MNNHRYFARIKELDDNKWIVTEMYMAESDDPRCQQFIDDGMIESIGDGMCAGDIWRKNNGVKNT